MFQGRPHGQKKLVKHKTNSGAFFFFALFAYFLFILSFFVHLFVCFNFIFVFPSFIIVFLKRDKKHKVGWIENWKGTARSWGRQQHDQNVLYTFIK